MSEFSLSDFSTIFKGGSRAYLFRLNATTIKEYFDIEDRNIKFFVKTTSIPATTIEENVTSFQQINYKSPNKKTFEDWSVTFNCDRKQKIRLGFEKWANNIHYIYSQGSFRKDESKRTIGIHWFGGNPNISEKLENNINENNIYQFANYALVKEMLRIL